MAVSYTHLDVYKRQSFLIILVALLLVLVFGNGIYDWLIETFPRLERLAFVVISMRFVVSLAVLSIFFTLLYLSLINISIENSRIK